LHELVAEFADALALVHGSGLIHKLFQAGIGPFGEAEAVRAALTHLRGLNPARYATARVKRLPALLLPFAPPAATVSLLSTGQKIFFTLLDSPSARLARY